MKRIIGSLARKLTLVSSVRVGGAAILLSSIGLHHLYLSKRVGMNEIDESLQRLSPFQLESFLKEVIDHFKGQYIDDGEQLSKLVHPGNEDTGELDNFAKDANSYHKTYPPICILYPTSTQDVADFLKICNNYVIQVVPFTKGTSLEGGVLPTSTQCAMINLSQMNRVLNFYEKDLQIQVEPAMGWMELNEFLAEHGLFFPVDPGPGAGIGGMVNTSCSGTNAFRYGTMREWVVNLEVVLADGRVINTAQRAKKSSAGYNLTNLMIGSEGTLGVVTKITLKVTHLPKVNSVVTICFDDLERLSQSVQEFVKNGINLGCVELMDKSMINLLMTTLDTELYKKVLVKDMNLLMLKIQGDPEEAAKSIRLVSEITNQLGGVNIQSATGQKDIDNLWNIRKRALFIVQQYAHHTKGTCTECLICEAGQVWTTDVCVPISQLSQHIYETQQIIDKSNVIGPIIGHVGDGNYHVLFVVDYGNQQEWDVIQGINTQMVLRAIQSEGTCTGVYNQLKSKEHGIGIGKREFLHMERGENSINLMRDIKRAFDPNGILNPGKIFTLA